MNNKFNSNNSVNLNEWLKGKTDDEIRTTFFNIDLTLKYIHQKGYCIKSFNPTEIEILNNSVKQIKFNTLLKLPNNFANDNELIHEDIYNSSFLQIGIYTKCLKYMKPNFLKENFDGFATFLPEQDIPYYRGVIQRGANVYFSDYVIEKRKRDIQNMNNEVETNDASSKSNGRSIIKNNGHYKSDYESNVVNSNKNINDSIYRQLNSINDAAFGGIMIFLTILFIVGIVIGLIVILS